MRHRCANDTGRGGRGYSMIEMMVGIALSLLVVSGVLLMFARHLDANRRLLLEARLQQDLRVAGDIVARDLRRAGYWTQAVEATASPAQASPNGSVAISGSAGAAQASYRYTNEVAPNDAAGTNDVGLRLHDATLQMKNGETWQDLTDPSTVTITQFSITAQMRDLPLGALCDPVCSSADATCPRLRLRSYDIVIGARSATDPSIVRESQQSVLVRNDDTSASACP